MAGKVRMTSNPVTLEIWPELWTLSGSCKSIPDYLPQVTDTSAVLRIRPLEFHLIILRHPEASRGGGQTEGAGRAEGTGCVDAIC